MLFLLFLLCRSTLLADGQCTLSGCKDQATEYSRKLEEYDEKLELLVQSISSRIFADVEKLFTNGFKQMKEYSLALSRETLEEQDLKLQQTQQNLTKEIDRVVASALVKVQQSLFQRLNQTLEEHDQTLQRVNQSLYREIAKVNEEIDSCGPSPLYGVYDCYDVKVNGFKASGTYRIYVDHQQKRYRSVVCCDMNTSNGNWLVFQRRKDGSQNFTRGWTDYANGFGDLNGEFWLGNEFLYLLTSKRKYKLRIDLENWNGEKRYAEYSHFSISSSADKYRLVAGGHSGNADDSLTGNSGARFSTYDNDNGWRPVNCALSLSAGGGWWYKHCASNLNGRYYHFRGWGVSSDDGIIWWGWLFNHYSFKTTEMKISPIA